MELNSTERNNRPMKSPSANIDFQLGDDEWGDADEIELGTEEHDLFLKDNHTNQPFKTITPVSDSSLINQANGGLPRIRSQNRMALFNCEDEDRAFDNEDDDSTQSTSLIDNKQQHSSIINHHHQVSNHHQQFSNNFAPSNIVASCILISVILCVTILPMITLSQPSTQANSKSLKDPIIGHNNNLPPPAQTDVRCKCICPPPPQSETNNSTNSTSSSSSSSLSSSSTIIKRRLYVGNTSPNQCNCDNIVQPHLIDSKIISKDFCVRCECRYQSRNTTTIRRNVVFFIAVLSGLGIYMLIQYLFKFLKITRRSLPAQFRWLSFQLTEDD